MNQGFEDTERSFIYYLCLFLMVLPIITILFLPLLTSGLSQLPWAILMSVFVLLPLLSCGTQFKGRPLFQFHYHGEPFVDEVMNVTDDEKVH